MRGIAVCLTATLVAVGCSPAAEDTDEIRIAIEGPISGDQSSNGIDMRDAAKLAIDEANAGGGVLGRTLRLIEADDAADPKRGVRVARDMIDEDVFAVIGPYNSSVGIENLPVYLEARVVPIHLTSNHATNGMGFTVQPKDYQVAPVEAEALAGFLDVDSVAIIYDTSTYTADIASQLKEELEDRDVEVPVYGSIEEGTEDFDDVLEEAAAANPDVLYVGTYYPEAARIIAQAADADVPGRCFLGLAAQDPALVEEAGVDVASGCLSSGVPSAQQFPEAEDYVRTYRDAYDRDPGTWGTFTYDSVNLLLDGVRRAEAWDVDDVSRELAHTEDFEGITGSITIDPETGNRVDVPVVVLDITGDGEYRVNDDWARFSGFARGAETP